jgi:hypothetical protein
MVYHMRLQISRCVGVHDKFVEMRRFATASCGNAGGRQMIFHDALSVCCPNKMQHHYAFCLVFGQIFRLLHTESKKFGLYWKLWA